MNTRMPSHHFGMDDWGKRRLNFSMEIVQITIPKDTLAFMQRWKRKRQFYPLDRLEHYFDRFFTSFVLYNFLYDEICFRFRLKWKSDEGKATKAAKRLLGAHTIFTDRLIRQSGDRIHDLIKTETFYIRDGVWDKQKIKKLAPRDPEQWVKGLLEIVYAIRCNTFHGKKSFDEGQKKILDPCIAVIERLNDMIIERMQT